MQTDHPASGLPVHEARRLWRVASAGSDPVATFREMERRRLEGHPLQYLEGTAAFGPLEVAVDERVLIPRPETEQLWELCTSLVPAAARIIDVGTGSGALALALAGSYPTAKVIGIDRSEDALAVAHANGARLGIEVDWRLGDLFAALDGSLEESVDLIVSNPPYVADSEWSDLPVDVRREPWEALVAGPTGLEVLERIAAEATRWLRPGGVVACEIGETQGPACVELFGATLREVTVRLDLAGRSRFVTGRRP